MSDPIAHKLKTAFSSFVPTTCLDVGANTGQFVTEWRKIFPNCEVTSIEPNPHCEKGLRKLGVKYLQCAVSDKIGKLELIVPKFKLNSKGGSFYKQIKFNSVPDDQILKITVPVTTLDTLFLTKKFDVIKIDVQGAELDVING
jgi:FkbM family methyltransferase